MDLSVTPHPIGPLTESAVTPADRVRRGHYKIFLGMAAGVG